MNSALSWRAAWRIARRELDLRFKGLRLLVVCLFLGAGALAAIGTLSAAIEGELNARGQEFLGGDLEVEVWQRDLNAAEKAALARYGTLSGGVRMQAMARAAEKTGKNPDGDNPEREITAPIGLKSVDHAYPLYGKLMLKDGRSVGAPPEGEAWLDAGAMDRLGLRKGDRFRIGSQSLTAAGVIASEPDRLSEGFQLGPTVIVAKTLPARAGLTAPGALYRSKYRVAFKSARDPSGVAKALEQQFPDAGLDFTTSNRASPGVDRFVGRMGEFLTLVALAALAIAGIGISLGVSSFLQARRNAIATLKVLGASSRDITRIIALQIGAAALTGSLLGIAAGVALTPLLGYALAGLLPVEPGLVIAPRALMLAALFGLLVALVFAAGPIVRARRVPAMALMRARVAPPGRRYEAWPWILGGLAGIVALVLATSQKPLLAGGFLIGAALSLALIALIGWGIVALARRAPRPSNPLMRAALANIHRPANATTSLVTALGFGLSAFALLAAIQTSIDGNIARTLPQAAPDYFVLDIPRESATEFESAVHGFDPQAQIRLVPTLRGAILAYGPKDAMVRVADLKTIPDEAWPLRGERGLTYSDRLPEGNSLVAGKWWPADYSGEPLVSVDVDFARAIDLKIGDYLTVGVLGTERRARVANLRQLDWENMNFNFVLVFSRNAIGDAPHNLTATIDLSSAKPRAPLLGALVRQFPSSSVIEVGDVLNQARSLLGQIGIASFAAALVAVLAGLAVLTGAIAAARLQRVHDTVVLRVLGASRMQILAMQLFEYLLLAGVLAVVALALGSALGWAVITQLFEFDWLPDWGVILGVLGGGLALVILFALGGSLPLLRTRPARALREL